MIAQLGQKGYDKYYERLKVKLELYKSDLKAQEEKLESFVGDDVTRITLMEEWIKEKSPFYYAKYIYDGVREKVQGKFINPKGYEYTSEIPRRISLAGKKTEWYDSKFDAVENDAHAEAFYNHMMDKFHEMRDYLPDYAVEDLQYNYLPEIKKSIAELYSEKGFMAAMRGSYNKFISEITTDELSETLNNEIDPTTQKKIPTLPITMVGKNLKAEEKSYDLPKIIKAFSMMALSYKHKSKVEDTIRITQQVINRALEKQVNAAGEGVIDFNGNPIATKDGLRNFKDQFEYAIRAFYGERRIIQGVLEKKAYTLEEKARLKEIDKQLERDDLEEMDRKNLENEKKQLGGNIVSSKVGDKILNFAQLKGMGWNLFAPTNNTLFSFMSHMRHAAGGEDFNYEEFLKAKEIMLHSIGKALSLDSFESKTAKKTANGMLKWNIVGEINQVAYSETAFNSGPSKGLQKLLPYALTKSAEYLNQGTTFVSMMHGIKIKNLKGEETFLWKAFDDNFDWKTDEYGPIPKEILLAAKIRTSQVVKIIHGNYDPHSPVRIKEGFFGRALMMFRSWVGEGYASRFQNEKFDSLLMRSRKGSYRTWNPITGGDIGILNGFRLLTYQMLNFLTFGNTYKTSLDQLSPLDKANMRKNAAEVLLYVSLYTMILMLKALKGDDDKNKYALNALINTGFRVQNDMAFFVSPLAFEKITQSSIPAMSIVIDAHKFLVAAEEAIAGNDTYQKGPFKDQSKVKIAIMRNLPGPTQIIRTVTGVTATHE